MLEAAGGRGGRTRGRGTRHIAFVAVSPRVAPAGRSGVAGRHRRSDDIGAAFVRLAHASEKHVVSPTCVRGTGKNRVRARCIVFACDLQTHVERDTDEHQASIMKKRTLRNSGIEVSALGYGCMGLEEVYGPAAAREEGIRIIRAAFDRGVTLCDFLRYGRGLWPVHERRGGGRSSGAVS